MSLQGKVKKYLWTALGFCSLGMAYIGVITPGIPYSPFVVFAAYCFSKGSERMHRWIYNHKLFGPFLTNWGEKRVFPTKMKFFMLAMMSTSSSRVILAIQFSHCFVCVFRAPLRNPGSAKPKLPLGT